MTAPHIAALVNLLLLMLELRDEFVFFLDLLQKTAFFYEVTAQFLFIYAFIKDQIVLDLGYVV